MKSAGSRAILHVTDDISPEILQRFLEFDERIRYDVTVVSSLEDAILLRDGLYAYDAVITDLRLKRGDEPNISDFLAKNGLASFPYFVDFSYGQIFSDMEKTSHFYEKRLSDVYNGLILIGLLRMQKENGGLGYTGGIVLNTAEDKSTVVKMLAPSNYYLVEPDEISRNRKLKPNEIVFLSKNYGVYPGIPYHVQLAKAVEVASASEYRFRGFERDLLSSVSSNN